MLDLKIANGRIPDFVDGILKEADIGIAGGRIVDVGTVPAAAHTIDAAGLVVSPGFIDIHMHEEVLDPDGHSGDGNAYDIANRMLAMGVTTAVGGNCGLLRQNLETFWSYVDAHGAPVNYVMFAGHSSLRELCGAESRYKPATAAQVRAMAAEARRQVDAGAIGVSFGLEYSPGANLDEAIGVCDGLRDREVLLSAHYRSDCAAGIESIREMAEISRRSGQPMQVSHLVSCSAMGYMAESLDVIAAAIADGVDLQADSYPYAAFCTRIGTAVFDDGCFERWGKGPEAIQLLEEPYRGRKCDAALFAKVRAEYPEMLVAAFVMNEEEAIAAICSPAVMVASDGLYNKGMGHPRGAGTFPRVLGRYAREQQRLGLVDALRKMTLMPAQRLRLDSKGRIEPGCDADFTIFDPATIIDRSDYTNPTLPPAGIHAVIIGGKLAMDTASGERHRLGKAIRRSDMKGWH
jgi:N-acyl-D-amino-acid deacylase